LSDQQSRYVGAGYQQHNCNRAEENQHRRSHLADHFIDEPGD